VFVDEDGEGIVDGFVIGRLVPAPAVYDPGGPSCSVDDFVVADGSQWNTVGADLLREVQRWARGRGAVQTIVVCGPHDVPKRQMLLEAGLQVVSEWFTGPLDLGTR
jgi:GNAT superfamily N-acetyltransferase